MTSGALRLILLAGWVGIATDPAFARADCVGAAARAAEADYARGVSAYRSGDVAGGYAALSDVLARCPATARYRNDFIVMAAASGHAQEALQADTQGPTGGPARPAYVLESLARAARDTSQPDLALHYYDELLAQGPNPAARVGRDLALLQRGDAEAAGSDLELLGQIAPGRTDVLEAQGLVAEAQGNPIAALGAAQAILAIDPGHVGALTLRYRALLQSGAPQLATALTPESLTTPEERARALRDTLALDYRSARDTPFSAKARATALDAVISRMHAAAGDATLGQAIRTGIREDLIEALVARGHAVEAILQYDSMRAGGLKPPAYVIEAMVGAFVTARQPDRAIEAYRTLPEGSEPTLGTRTQYVFALLEAGHYGAAVAASDELAARMATHPVGPSPVNAPLRGDAADAVSARVLAALTRSYTDRPSEGYRRLRALLADAPADPDVRIALAETEILRGWPRRGAELSASVLNDTPDATAAMPKLFDARLQDGDFRAAHAALDEISARLPSDDQALAHAQRDWQTHDMAELLIDGQWGRSHGGRPGVIDSSAEEYVYSPPFAWDYRAFVHLNQSEGTPVQGNTWREAVGAGIEYHTADWLATAELLGIEHNAPAPQLSIEATPNDQWTVGGAYALRTLDIPIAAFVVGVHADRIAVDVGHRVDESREFGATLDHEAFSDGNSRSEATAFWRERWIDGPNYTLDTRTDLDASGNTLPNTNYFNPRRDFTAMVTLQNRWLQARFYERALRHELDLGLGDYTQQGHGNGLVATIRYQLVYEITDRLAIKGGASTTLRPYDGERERLDALHLNLTGRF